MNWPHLESSFQGTHWPRGLRLPLAWQSVAFLCCVGVSQKKWCTLLAKHSKRVCFRVCVCVGECHWFFLHIQMRKFCRSWVDYAMSKVHEVCMILTSDSMRCRPGHCKANEFQVSLSTSLYRYGVWITLSIGYTYMHAYIIKQNHLRILAILWLRSLESWLHSWIISKFSSQVSPLWIPRPPRIFCRWLTCPTSWACWSETWRKKQTNSCTNALLVNQWIYPTPKKNKGGKRDISQWKQLGFPSVFYIWARLMPEPPMALVEVIWMLIRSAMMLLLTLDHIRL